MRGEARAGCWLSRQVVVKGLPGGGWVLAGGERVLPVGWAQGLPDSLVTLWLAWLPGW